MGREKVLITVKTYLTLSRKHDELLCTAGVREDGSWVGKPGQLFWNCRRAADGDERVALA